MEKPWRILIIDDDSSFRLSISCVLEHWANVRVAHDTESAQNLLTSWHPHAVILDPALRTGDSIDLLYRIVGEGQRIIFCALSRCTHFPPSYCNDTIVYVLREYPAKILGQIIEQRVRETFTEVKNASQSPTRRGNSLGDDLSFDKGVLLGNGKQPERTKGNRVRQPDLL